MDTHNDTAGSWQEEDGGVDSDISDMTMPSPWVEGGLFVLPDGSHCQLCTRIMWFDDAGQLIRVIVNQVRANVPPSVNIDIRLWSAQPSVCQMSGLKIHQACSLQAPRMAIQNAPLNGTTTRTMSPVKITFRCNEINNFVFQAQKMHFVKLTKLLRFHHFTLALNLFYIQPPLRV